MSWSVAFLCVLALAYSQASPAQDMIDEMIYELDKSMVDKHQDTFNIPDIDENIEKKFGWFKVRGEFTATGGYFRNVSTLRRLEPMEMTQNDSIVTLGISLGLDDMEFGFKEYRAEIFHIGVHGNMRVTVGKNEVYGHLTMNIPEEGDCKTHIDKLELRKIEDFHVDMTGLGRDADWIYSYVVQLLANKYHDKIAQAVSKKLLEVATDAIAKHDICDKLGF